MGRLEHGPGFGYRFHYLRAAAVEGFQAFLSFPDLSHEYRSERLFPLFSQRIMSWRRPDFAEYLRQLHLDAHATPWEQLARSEGRRTGDTVQMFPVPSVEADGSSTCFFLVHGIRYVTGGPLPVLAPGDRLELRREPGNVRNLAARLVCTSDGAPLGYVPDLLLDHLDAMLGTGPVSLTVEHVNGPEAPPHLRLLVRLAGSTPPGYVPMSGGRWRRWGS
ncbi:HIRAN domain-containing protein [Pseudonocardia sp. HH130630-07]|uniref:HIRAN domain-containing protein n=1 Tax=Pseudonocardia sp. HH130630-07 TaxID=1690815 RepID=UPI0009F3D430|nr:HIRAN domain-containing protein [Pseudonocardia sp. HH130630-07]